MIEEVGGKSENYYSPTITNKYPINVVKNFEVNMLPQVKMEPEIKKSSSSFGYADFTEKLIKKITLLEEVKEELHQENNDLVQQNNTNKLFFNMAVHDMRNPTSSIKVGL